MDSIFEKLEDHIAAQKAKIAGMFQNVSKANRALSLLSEGAKYPYTQVEEVVFSESTQSEQQITMQLPEAHDIFAQRLSIYPLRRFVSTDPTVADDQTFRPCVFTTGEQVFDSLIEDDPASLDLRVAVSEVFTGKNGNRVARDLQNAPVPSQLFYSDCLNYKNNNQTPLPTFDTGKGLFFVRDWYLPAGSAVTFKISPQFASVLEDPASFNPTLSNKNQYKVVVVLDGYKKVN